MELESPGVLKETNKSISIGNGSGISTSSDSNRKQMKVEMIGEKDRKNPTASPSDGENAMEIHTNGCKKVPPNKKRERTLTEDQNRNIKRKKTDGYQPPKLSGNIDIFCWRCHKDGTVTACSTCPRVYHLRCARLESLPPQPWVCFECEAITRADIFENRSETLKLINSQQFSNLLKYVTERMCLHEGSFHFFNSVDLKEFPDYKDFVVRPMYIALLESNIRNLKYGSTESFIADTKWLVHNSIIFNSVHSELTTFARALVKIAKQEAEEIENCPFCYLHAHTLDESTWFVEPCEKPHVLVWARLKGFPFWPGKVMRTMGSNADIRFFGDHNRAWVPVDSIFLYSKRVPASTKQIRLNNLDVCIKEIEEHVKKLEEKYKKFVYFPFRTPYNPKRHKEILDEMLPFYSEKSDCVKTEYISDDCEVTFEENSCSSEGMITIEDVKGEVSEESEPSLEDILAIVGVSSASLVPKEEIMSPEEPVPPAQPEEAAKEFDSCSKCSYSPLSSRHSDSSVDSSPSPESGPMASVKQLRVLLHKLNHKKYFTDCTNERTDLPSPDGESPKSHTRRTTLSRDSISKIFGVENPEKYTVEFSDPEDDLRTPFEKANGNIFGNIESLKESLMDRSLKLKELSSRVDCCSMLKQEPLVTVKTEEQEPTAVHDKPEEVIVTSSVDQNSDSIKELMTSMLNIVEKKVGKYQHFNFKIRKIPKASKKKVNKVNRVRVAPAKDAGSNKCVVLVETEADQPLESKPESSSSIEPLPQTTSHTLLKEPSPIPKKKKKILLTNGIIQKYGIQAIANKIRDQQMPEPVEESKVDCTPDLPFIIEDDESEESGFPKQPEICPNTELEIPRNLSNEELVKLIRESTDKEEMVTLLKEKLDALEVVLLKRQADAERNLKDLKSTYEFTKSVEIFDAIQKYENKSKEIIEENKRKHWCVLCLSEAKFYCCFGNSYCSVKCQLSDWKNHVTRCTQYKMRAGDPDLRLSPAFRKLLLNHLNKTKNGTHYREVATVGDLFTKKNPAIGDKVTTGVRLSPKKDLNYTIVPRQQVSSFTVSSAALQTTKGVFKMPIQPIVKSPTSSLSGPNKQIQLKKVEGNLKVNGMNNNTNCIIVCNVTQSGGEGGEAGLRSPGNRFVVDQKLVKLREMPKGSPPPQSLTGLGKTTFPICAKKTIRVKKITSPQISRLTSECTIIPLPPDSETEKNEVSLMGIKSMVPSPSGGGRIVGGIGGSPEGEAQGRRVTSVTLSIPGATQPGSSVTLCVPQGPRPVS